ncbi:MAG: class I SAM-dependent methyltransferase [Desulfamplus sp.]|nr:class I SAM-dependent methyltransferase [Desulfamplus sp.]
MMDVPSFRLDDPDNSCEIVQGEERFIITCDNGETLNIRAHDYGEIYKVPGLYEYLFYENYKCKSPTVIRSELEAAVESENQDMSRLKVFDVGAGNGMVGEELVSAGVEKVVGIDIIEEAALATERDRPGIYADYFIEDLTRLPSEVEQKLINESFNCMTLVAALGFDDIPPHAFAEAYNFISESGWVAFNIKEEFCSKKDQTGFSKLIENMTQSGIIDMKSQKLYTHRLCQDGTPLNYFAIVGKKQEDIPAAMIST